MLLTKESMELDRWSINSIINDEQKGIFFYLIKPINHNQKPEDAEEFTINTTLYDD